MDVPTNTLVACPKHKFEFVRIVNHCIGCAYFQGFERGAESGDFAFDHRVICAYPMTRTIKQFKED